MTACDSHMDSDPLQFLLGQNVSGQSPTLHFLFGEPFHVSLGTDAEDSAAEVPEIADADEVNDASAAITAATAEFVERAYPQAVQFLRAQCNLLRADIAAFGVRSRFRWRRGLSALERLILLSHEIGAEFTTHCAATGPEGVKAETLVRLHARAVQVANEVLVLLKHGYADGAQARWRTLHEIAVVATFLAEQPESVSVLYVEHNDIESWRAIDEYNKHCAALGFAPPSPDELAARRARWQELISKYGRAFGEAYGWAAVALGRNDRPGLQDIVEAVEMSHTKPLYRMASNAVHAASKSMFVSMAQPDWPSDVLLSGPSNAGLCDPGQNTAISVAGVTAAMLSCMESLDTLVLCQLLSKMTAEAKNCFFEAHQQLEAEEAQTRSEEGGDSTLTESTHNESNSN